MAETLDQFDFKGVGRNGGRIYPWAQWLDGRIWKVIKGVDYTVSERSFQTTVNAAARRAGKFARCNRVIGENAVVFQAYDKPESEATNET